MDSKTNPLPIPGRCITASLILFRQLLPDSRECAPPLVRHRRLAGACFARAVRAADGTETEATLVAQRLHRNRELNLIDRHVAKRERSFRIELDVELLRGDLDFLFSLLCV